MPDARWLVQWMRAGDGEWMCCGPVQDNVGFVVIGSGNFRTPVEIYCDRTDSDKPVSVRAHMMGPGKDLLKVYDDSFWERWYLPPGGHPCDVEAKAKEEGKYFSDNCGWDGSAKPMVKKSKKKPKKKAKKKAKKKVKKKSNKKK